MARNGSGAYTLPEPPFVPLTTISSAAMNSDLSDIASALTASLARDGQGGMTAVLPLNTAGFSYTSDTNTGMYRTGSDAQAIKVGGVDMVAINSTGLDVAGSVKQSGSILIPVGLGPVPWSLSTAPALWALCYGQACTSTYAAYRAALIADGSPYGNNGTDPLFPDMRGYAPLGKTNMGGSTSTVLTSTYFIGNPTTLGATGGTQGALLAENELPNVNRSLNGTAGTVNVTSGVSDVLRNPSGLQTQAQGVPQGGIGTGTPGGTAIDSTGTFTPQGTININGNVSQVGLTRVQPGLILNYIVFVGV